MTSVSSYKSLAALLEELGISEPQEINIEAIAECCGATIIYEPLKGCEARILGHGDRAPEVFSVGGRSFGDGIARAAGAIPLRVPALNHEALDDAVKNRISVETLAG